MGKIDLTGQKFSRLTVVRKSGKNKHGHVLWLCKCNCGNERRVGSQTLRIGNTKSCGCFQREEIIKRNIRRAIHNMSNSRDFHKWCSIIYKNYGGRGIKVCDKWMTFKGYFEDMGKCPIGMSLDRIDNNGNYCKENCRWATRKEQQNNTRNNVKITHDGLTLTIKQWSEKKGIKYEKLLYRFHAGWATKKIFTK